MNADENPYASPTGTEQAPSASRNPPSEVGKQRVDCVVGMWFGMGVALLLGAGFFPTNHAALMSANPPALGVAMLVGLSLVVFACSAIATTSAVRLTRLGWWFDLFGGVSGLVLGCWLPALWVVVWWASCLLGLVW